MVAVFASTAFIPTGRRDRRRGRHDRAVAEGAGGAVRRPGRAAARRRGPRGSARPGRRTAGRRGAALRRPAGRARHRSRATPRRWSAPLPTSRRRAHPRRGRPCVRRPRHCRDGPPARAPGHRGSRGRRRRRAAARRWTSVVELGEGRLDEELLAPARELSRRAGERLRLSGAHTVVALAGRDRQRQVDAVQRPGRHADVADGGAAADHGGRARGRLGRRRARARCSTGWRSRGVTTCSPHPATTTCAGSSCSTCPTTTRREVAHRLEVDRLVALVDVLVWVLDPQKYADAAIHDRYLRPLARHGEVMVVVLNQVDRLAPDAVPDARGRRPPAARRRRPAPTCRCCACRRSPAIGLDRLRDVLTGAVTAHRAALRRIAADLDTVARRSRSDVVGGPARDDVDGGAQRALVAALGRGGRHPGGRRGGAARVCAPRRGRRPASRSPAGCGGCGRTRCAGCTSTGPVRRRSRLLRPHDDDATPTSRRPRSARRCPRPVPSSGRAWTWPCAVSPTTPPRACPTRGRDALRDAARSRAGDLADSLDRAVATTDLGVTRRAALVARDRRCCRRCSPRRPWPGALWLAGLYALTVLRLPGARAAADRHRSRCRRCC